jgi:hypothetical protein
MIQKLKMKQSSIFWDTMLCSPFNGLHGVISQMTELFITTAVKTKNPKKIKQILLHFQWKVWIMKKRKFPKA